METRKASAAEPRLDLYALAQVRASEVVERLGERCKDCPGPHEPNGCMRRRRKLTLLGRSDWPLCPLGMLRVPLWQGIADTYRASKISPIAGFPDSVPCVVFDGLLEIDLAVAANNARLMKEAQSAAAKSAAGPSYRRR